MKTKLLSFVACMLALPTFAQSGDFPNDSISQGTNVDLSPGSAVVANDSVGIFRPGFPNIPYPSGPKAPVRPIAIGVYGHTVYTYGLFEGYTLYILHNGEIVYFTDVWADETAISLPASLSGSYTIVFADGCGGCYYGYIFL